jgi:hypothetical protein
MLVHINREGQIMPTKGKARPRREKPTLESATYTTDELKVRYHCSRRTLRRMTANLGFPAGEKRGRTVIYAKVPVHDWERVHMPSLHTAPEKSEEDKHWDRLRARYLLDKEELLQRPPDPAKRRRVVVHRGSRI